MVEYYPYPAVMSVRIFAAARPELICSTACKAASVMGYPSDEQLLLPTDFHQLLTVTRGPKMIDLLITPESKLTATAWASFKSLTLPLICSHGL